MLLLKVVIICIVGVFVFGVFVIPFLMCGYDKWKGTHYSCDWYGSHDGHGDSKERYFDGCSYHAVCSKCGKRVMQDSQGNWF